LAGCPSPSYSTASRGRAIAAAEEALKLDPKQDWIRTNLAHGYLFDGHYERTKAMYLKYKDVKAFRNQTFVQAVLDDFKQFRKHGLTHPDRERIERLLTPPAVGPAKPPAKKE
jgi:hypothetical protein